MCSITLINITYKFKLFKRNILVLRKYSIRGMEIGKSEPDIGVQTITEGLAIVKTSGNVFYNPVQEFNRDLSISVISAFAKLYRQEKESKKSRNTKPEDVKIILKPVENELIAGVSYENGLTILEALSATGLRSIRYAKEIPGVKQILANDISIKAVESIKQNVLDNGVENLVTANQNDATMVMYEHRRKQFDVIDLDPYGCPSIFLDGAVQAVQDGGLLLVTATDMAVLAGNCPETCYSKYGAISLRLKSCHEMALRILLQCVESHANRYGRYIVPLLSISADFYVRVFVRVFTGPNKCKYTTSKLSMVYHCTTCDSFTLSPLGILKKNDKNANQVKFALPPLPSVGVKCQHCQHTQHLGGPIWSGPLYSPDFVQEVLQTAPERLVTYKRIQGVLNVVLEELIDVPLYYTLARLAATLHVETPPMLILRSAILNAGYKVSYTHMNKMSVKTNAPGQVIWDIMRCWAAEHPVSKKRLTDGSAAANILAVEPIKVYSFEMNGDANPESRKKGFLRFQENPTSHWGPGTRATAMVGAEKISKSKRNQGKRKREQSQENHNTEEIKIN